MPGLNSDHNRLLRPAVHEICSIVSSVPVCAGCNRARGIGSAGAQLHFDVVIANNMPCTRLYQKLYPCLHSVSSWTTVLCTSADLPEQKERPIHPCSADDCNFAITAYATDSLHAVFVTFICIISLLNPFLEQRNNRIVTKLMYKSVTDTVHSTGVL